MMLWLLWALACHAKADDYSYNVSDPVYTKLTDQLQRLKREHKPLRLKVNSHTGAGKTYFIRHRDAKYRGCRLLDFDDFEGANLLMKEYIDRSIWVAPMPRSMTSQKETQIAKFFQEQHSCGLVVDVRLRQGRTIPGRTRPNVYCVIEYAHENSVPRSLKLASKKLARFDGQPVRVYKAGTKTAVNMPSQRRRGH